MRIGDQRRSTNFEDRGRGSTGGGGGFAVQLLVSSVRLLGVKGTLILGGLVAALLALNPFGVRSLAAQALFGDGGAPSGGGGSVCATAQAACDFSARVLGATEDVWREQFQKGALPSYGRPVPAQYQDPTLVVFSQGVQTGCGPASSALGPFYCPLDKKLYIDPGFYEVMEAKLRAPGDFAQAYVIAHEVGHHVQNLIGSSDKTLPGETKNQTSVRVELQADCFAGVWGHQKGASLAIDETDLREALNAAHAIGDDTLGHRDARDHTHGTSEQRMRWFRKGFDSGEPRACDTFAVASP